MSQSYFLKEQLSNSFLLDGRPVPWEPLSGNAGVLSTETDSALDVGLTKLVGRLGVIKITLEDYESKKKLRPLPLSVKRFKPGAIQAIRPRGNQAPPASPMPSSEAAAPAPSVAPRDAAVAKDYAPRLGKLKEVPVAA